MPDCAMNRQRPVQFEAAPGKPVFRLKDPGSALTHLAGLILAVFATPPLLIHCADREMTTPQLGAVGLFLLSMIGLYAASSAYHSFNLAGKGNKALKKLDHTMIFYLIAGTYTPICLIPLAGNGGERLLLAVWAVALGGTVLKQLWVTHPKWLSSVLYISMGWLCVARLPALLEALRPAAFGWLLAGGVLYTVGGVLYALKLERLNRMHPDFGSHEIFHLFVLGGSLCHYICMFFL